MDQDRHWMLCPYNTQDIHVGTIHIYDYQYAIVNEKIDGMQFPYEWVTSIRCFWFVFSFLLQYSH